MKRILSIVLTILLIITAPISTFASTTPNNSPEELLSQSIISADDFDNIQIAKDLKLIVSIFGGNLPAKLTKIIPGNNYIYVFEYSNGIINDLEVIYKSGATDIICSQGTISNTITISGENIAVDGMIIDCTSDNIIKSNYDWFSTSCPYGTSSSYSYYHHTENNSNIPLGNAIINLTLAAFELILSKINPFNVMWDVFVDLAESVYDLAVANYPASTSVSFKADVYTRTDGSRYISSNYGYCYKYIFYMYTGINFTGDCTTGTYFRQMLTY